MTTAQSLILLSVCVFVHGAAIAEETPRHCIDLPFVEVDASRKATSVDQLEGQVVGHPPEAPPGELGSFGGMCLTLFGVGGGRPLATVMTNSTGAFQFANPGAGDYVLIWAGPKGTAGAPLRVARPGAAGSPERGLLLQLPVERDGRGDVALIGNLALRRQLLAMLKPDQDVRNDIIASGAGSVSPELQKRMADTDANTDQRLREIVQKYGWPARDLVGLDGATAAMTMIQHVPAETQRRVLPAVEAAFHAGTVRGGEYANLLDHVLLSEGKPQRYGTRARPLQADGIIEFYPIEDEAHVDERRAEVGLMPLAEYRNLLRQMYFPKK